MAILASCVKFNLPTVRLWLKSSEKISGTFIVSFIGNYYAFDTQEKERIVVYFEDENNVYKYHFTDKNFNPQKESVSFTIRKEPKASSYYLVGNVDGDDAEIMEIELTDTGFVLSAGKILNEKTKPIYALTGGARRAVFTKVAKEGVAETYVFYKKQYYLNLIDDIKRKREEIMNLYGISEEEVSSKPIPKKSEPKKQKELPKVKTPSMSFNDFLKEYEAYAEKHIELYRKYRENPADNPNAYYDLVSEVAIWSEKWDLLEGTPTKEQVKKYSTINKRITDTYRDF